VHPVHAVCPFEGVAEGTRSPLRCCDTRNAVKPSSISIARSCRPSLTDHMLPCVRVARRIDKNRNAVVARGTLRNNAMPRADRDRVHGTRPWVRGKNTIEMVCACAQRLFFFFFCYCRVRVHGSGSIHHLNRRKFLREILRDGRVVVPVVGHLFVHVGRIFFSAASKVQINLVENIILTFNTGYNCWHRKPYRQLIIAIRDTESES
jgi:hypothetical protein